MCRGSFDGNKGMTEDTVTNACAYVDMTFTAEREKVEQ